VRLATFNILSGRSPSAPEVDVDRFAAAVTSLDADVLALQEVDRRQPRSGYVDLAEVAATAAGAVEHRFAAAMTGPGDDWVPATGDEPPDAPVYGIALLSRWPVTGWRTVRLPGLPLRVPHRWPGSRRLTWVRDEQRVALVAEVHSPHGLLRVVTTHLSFVPWSGARQLRRLLTETADVDVLMGDLNMPPERAARMTGMRPLATAPTFPADAPTAQLDHLLSGSAALVATHGAAVQLAVSDHRALVADV
jgi:endonuclease/exonuclease/phosphatase family metal-dependent hydrolase